MLSVDLAADAEGTRSKKDGSRLLHTAFEALKYFFPLLQSEQVRVLIDNKLVVFYIAKQDGTRSLSLLWVTVEIFQWADRHVIALKNLKYLWKIFEVWGTPSIDLMATAQNACFPHVLFQIQGLQNTFMF